jgi:hypothetical protein
VHTSILPIRATCPVQLIRLDFTTCTTLDKEYRSFISSLCSFLHSPVTSTLLWYYAAQSGNSLPTFRDNLSGPIFKD